MLDTFFSTLQGFQNVLSELDVDSTRVQAGLQVVSFFMVFEDCHDIEVLYILETYCKLLLGNFFKIFKKNQQIPKNLPKHNPLK